MDRLKELGFTLYSALEYEFTLCDIIQLNDGNKNSNMKDTEDITPAFRGVDIFATLQNSKSQAFCETVESHLLQVGIDVQTMNAEYGVGQLEITIAPSWDMKAADDAFTFKTGPH